MTVFPFRRFFPIAAGVLCLGLASCSSTKKTKSGYAGVVDYTTPDTNLSQEEYPFDENGNYLADVVSGKKKGRKNKKSEPPKPEPAVYDRPPEPAVAAASPTPSPNYETPPAGNPAYTPVYSSGSTASAQPSRPTSTAGTQSPPPSSSASSSSSPSSSGSKPKTAASSQSKAKPKPKPKPQSSSISYTVKKGDTLYGLANRYGTSVAAIKKASGLSSDLLRDGRTIKIPRK